MKLWYGFSRGKADGDRAQKDLLGGKGANLAEMSRLGIPVPPGFTLPTLLCQRYRAENGLSQEVLAAIDEGLAFIEQALGTGAKIGDAELPLLVSVRSGARASMPGMMDTVLNLGLSRAAVEGLASASGNRRFALDSYRRLLQMYGDVVMGIDRELLEAPLSAQKSRRGVHFDHELSVEDLEAVVGALEGVYHEATGQAFPQDGRAQVVAAVEAVFRSWDTKRARTYRALNGIPDDWGTAANVQAMVFGNFGSTSGTGVVFTRDPSTGEKRVMGEWLANAQGEDVVAGIRTPAPLHAPAASAVADGDSSSAQAPLQVAMPQQYDALMELLARLEGHFADMQDVEFTIQQGELFLLQTRTGKRTAAAALKIAVDMVREGAINQATAVGRVQPEQIDQLMHPQLDPKAPKTLLAQGLPASPGAASGVVVIDPDHAEKLAGQGTDVILVRKETSPEDIHGMHAARGILTATGGMTSHAAVVARGMGRPCVSGCAALQVDEAAGQVRIADTVVRVGEPITLDGARGQIYLGVVPTVQADLSGDFAVLMGWADEIRTLRVRANADTPADAKAAVELGAEGIGLCRTEHMFFAPDRIAAVREMILAADLPARARALEKLAPMQRSDFVGIFEAMGARPVTIRLLDPPLHEFLPPHDAPLEELTALARGLGVSVDQVRHTRDSLMEFNPMLGHRGCRLGLTFPEIYEMQARAILEAACEVKARGLDVQPEIMIPLVMGAEELRRTRAQVEAVAQSVFDQAGMQVPYTVGTMIELPRAALLADEIAAHADFFSFGTNDLTQTTMGLSRDDAGRFLPHYVREGLLPTDPFVSLDQSGVGQLVSLATSKGRGIKPALKVGVCGEHGGDPASIRFFAAHGLNYVSCSPYRLPVARLALAHAALESKHA